MGECCSHDKNSCCSSNSCDSSCSCCCHQKPCESTCQGEDHDEKINWLLEVADEAWMEVLKGKIKEHILANHNDRMNELARIVSEGNNHRWRMKMEKKKTMKDFKEKICQFFGQFKQ